MLRNYVRVPIQSGVSSDLMGVAPAAKSAFTTEYLSDGLLRLPQNYATYSNSYVVNTTGWRDPITDYYIDGKTAAIRGSASKKVLVLRADALLELVSSTVTSVPSIEIYKATYITSAEDVTSYTVAHDSGDPATTAKIYKSYIRGGELIDYINTSGDKLIHKMFAFATVSGKFGPEADHRAQQEFTFLSRTPVVLNNDTECVAIKMSIFATAPASFNIGYRFVWIEI